MLGRGERGGLEGGGCCSHITLSPSAQLYFFLSDAVVPGLGIQLRVLELGMTLKQDTVTTLLNLCTRTPKGLVGCTVPSPGLANSGFTVNASVLPGDEDGPLVLRLRHPSL